MPRYIIERNIEGLQAPSVEALYGDGRKSVEIGRELGIMWIRTYMSEAEGKMYCEYEAASPELLLEHARRMGIPADKISEVKLEINPAMFV
ncbi:MAG: DUF4242 domain-containing protein [Rhodothermales bacterium]|nr:DUF4242 domain-containing protein [Rhodothermales bacterium]